MRIETEIDGQTLLFDTDEKLFSPTAADRGTLAMLELTQIPTGSKVLDLGCGYGPVGVVCMKRGAGSVLMTDVNDKAVECARHNLELNGIMSGAEAVVSDGMRAVTDSDFDLILSNPPYHTDFSVAKHFIEQGYKHLKAGGSMVMVTKRRLWYENKLKSVFGGCRVVERDGYFIFTAEKREKKSHHGENGGSARGSDDGDTKQHLSKKLARKYHRSI